MKTGTELIAEERQKQIDKHGFTGEHHAQHPEWYSDNQLTFAASHLANGGEKKRFDDYDLLLTPTGWSAEWYQRLLSKPYLERLAISGALIAAEIDRLQSLNPTTHG